MLQRRRLRNLLKKIRKREVISMRVRPSRRKLRTWKTRSRLMFRRPRMRLTR